MDTPNLQMARSSYDRQRAVCVACLADDRRDCDASSYPCPWRRLSGLDRRARSDTPCTAIRQDTRGSASMGLTHHRTALPGAEHPARLIVDQDRHVAYFHGELAAAPS